MMESILLRRIAASLRDLGDFLDVQLDASSADELMSGVDALADAAVNGLLDGDRAVSDLTVSVIARFRVSWPTDDEVQAMLEQAASEMLEVRAAVADARGRPDLRADAIMEIGDAMLALARLGVALGARSPLEPLGLSLRKTVKRLRHFEALIAAGGGHSRRDLWRMAKSLAAG